MINPRFFMHFLFCISPSCRPNANCVWHLCIKRLLTYLHYRTLSYTRSNKTSL